jgi:Uma2 family endonuclease
MIQTPVKPLTLEAFLQLPETKPASEYQDGKIIQKPMPKGKHSLIQTELLTVLNGALKPQAIGLAFSELRCTFGERSIVPDIAVFAWSRIPCDQNGEIANIFELAPDWIIEVLSPDQSQTRVTKNILYSLQHGTQMGWLIDPEEQTVLVYLPSEPVQVFDQPSQQLSTPQFAQGCRITILELFGWLQIRPQPR